MFYQSHDSLLRNSPPSVSKVLSQVTFCLGKWKVLYAKSSFMIWSWVTCLGLFLPRQLTICHHVIALAWSLAGFCACPPLFVWTIVPSTHGLCFSTISKLWVNKFAPTWPHSCIAWIDFSSNVSGVLIGDGCCCLVGWSSNFEPLPPLWFSHVGWLLLGLLRSCLQCWVATLLWMLPQLTY